MAVPLFVCCWLLTSVVSGGLSSLEIDAEVKMIGDNRVACGPLCCWYCLARFGQNVPARLVIERARLGPEGISSQGLIDLCKSFGLSARAISGPRDRLFDLPIPAIVFLDDRHCVVYDGRGENRAYESVRVFEPVTRHVGDEDARKLRALWSGEAIVFADLSPSPIGLYAVCLGVAAITVVVLSVSMRVGRRLGCTGVLTVFQSGRQGRTPTDADRDGD